MILLAVALALTAAVMHGSWNVLLKVEGDPLQVAARAITLSNMALAPVGLITWLLLGRPGLPAGSYLLAAVSGTAEVIYFLVLSEAYRRGDISQVYPTARGGAAALSIAAGILILHENLHQVEVLGIALLVAGMLMVRNPIASAGATVPALLTAACIAAYSTLDAAGVRLGSPWLYGWLLWVITAALLNLVVRAMTGPAGQVVNLKAWRAALIGLLMSGAYLLVLLALSLAPLTIVAPVRESATVGVTVWGVWRLGEPRASFRLLGAVLIMAGISAVALS
jgi:uncharacterized membrane protein